MSDVKRHLFIVGVGRSGTSLLQAMLASHSGIEIIPETGVLRNHVFKSSFSRTLEAQGEHGLIQLISNDVRLKRVSAITDALNHLLSVNTDVSELDKRLYEGLFIDPATRYAGDKDPKLVEHIDLLIRLWPDCKIIHIYRDPRDVLASKKKAAWSISQSTFKQLLASVAQFQMAQGARRHYSDKAIVNIKYENLVQQPSAVMHQLCRWLGVPFDTDTLDHAAAANKLVAGDELQWKSETLKPILANNVGKWTSSLSSFEVACTEYSCSGAMRAGEYTASSESSLYKRMLAAGYSLVVKLAASIYVAYRRISNGLISKKL